MQTATGRRNAAEATRGREGVGICSSRRTGVPSKESAGMLWKTTSFYDILARCWVKSAISLSYRPRGLTDSRTKKFYNTFLFAGRRNGGTRKVYHLVYLILTGTNRASSCVPMSLATAATHRTLSALRAGSHRSSSSRGTIPLTIGVSKYRVDAEYRSRWVPP